MEIHWKHIPHICNIYTQHIQKHSPSYTNTTFNSIHTICLTAYTPMGGICMKQCMCSIILKGAPMCIQQVTQVHVKGGGAICLIRMKRHQTKGRAGASGRMSSLECGWVGGGEGGGECVERWMCVCGKGGGEHVVPIHPQHTPSMSPTPHLHMSPCWLLLHTVQLECRMCSKSKGHLQN